MLGMAKFVIGSKGKSWQIEGDAPIGKKISDVIEIPALPGYELQITGGTDTSGFPMRPDVEGITKKRLLLEKGLGFSGKIRGKKKKSKPKKIEGLRKKKMIRGNVIDLDTMQINCKIVKEGEKTLDELIPAVPKEEKKKERR